MTAFNEHHFEKKLHLLKESQDSIQSLSSWCLQHRQQHKKVVSSWLKVLKKVKVDHRLSLFYLANDVIQYSKRKNYDFVESWATALQRATPMVREERVKHRILRIFKIWDERGIYDEGFIADLTDLLNPPAKKQPEVITDTTDFTPSVLFVKIRSCHKLEDDTDLRLKRLNESHLSFSDADALRRHLKDRRQGDDMVAEVDDGVKKMEAYVKALQLEIKERKVVIEELDLAEKYYEAQKGEAKIVVNAYRNFGSRVKNLKRHLDELLPSFAPPPSPVPSPDINAPSPGPDNDIELELPDDNMADMFPDAFTIPGLGSDGAQDQALDNCFASFMGNSLPFDIQKFSETSVDVVVNESEGKPIEVISSRTESEMEASLSNFLKSLGSLGSMSPTIAMPDLMDSSTPPLHLEPPPYISADQSGFEEEDCSVPMVPPPLPPNLFAYEDREQDDSWKTKLPAKFPSWEGEGWAEENGDWLPHKQFELADLETPESPPPCEKEGFSDPLEYDDVAATLGGSADVDHRSLMHPAALAATKTHINSLGQNQPLHVSEPITLQTDVDQRLLHIPLPSVPKSDVDHRTQVMRKNDVDHRAQVMRKNDVDHRTQVMRKNDVDHRAQVMRKNDVDHRPQVMRKNDVDHRNLISLTGSPGPEREVSSPAPDRDYRSHARTPDPKGSRGEDRDYRLPPPPFPPLLLVPDENRDNVESVDMDMSDEELADHPVALDKKDKPPSKQPTPLDSKDSDKPIVSFNINNQGSKLIGVSPLNEVAEETPKNNRKIPVLQSPPPPRGSALLPTPGPLQSPTPTFRPPSMDIPRPHMSQGPPRHMLEPLRQQAPPRLMLEPLRQQGPPRQQAPPRLMLEPPRQQAPPRLMLEPLRQQGPPRQQAPPRMFVPPQHPHMFDPSRQQGPPNIVEPTMPDKPRPLLSPQIVQPMNDLPSDACDKLVEVAADDLPPMGNGGPDLAMDCDVRVRDARGMMRDPRDPAGDGDWMHRGADPEWQNKDRWNGPPNPFNQFPPRGGFNPRPRGGVRPHIKGPWRGGGPPPRGMPFGGHGPRGGFRPPFMGHQGNFGGW